MTVESVTSRCPSLHVSTMLSASILPILSVGEYDIALALSCSATVVMVGIHPVFLVPAYYVSSSGNRVTGYYGGGSQIGGGKVWK